MAENIKLSDIIPASPEAVYGAWLDAEQHSKMTKSHVTDEGSGRFTASDGYISGRTVSAVPHSKIVQTWRTNQFPPDAPDSTLTVLFAPFDGGTQVTLVHENLPEGQSESYRDGWHAHYFAPMKAYFASPIGKARTAVQDAKVRARKEAIKAVKVVKEVRKKVAAELKTLGKKARALVTRKPKKKAAPAKKKKAAAPTKKKKTAAKKKSKR